MPYTVDTKEHELKRCLLQKQNLEEMSTSLLQYL